MEKVVFNKNLSKSVLEKLNISINESANIADGVEIEKGVVIGKNCTIGKNSKIGSFSILLNAEIGENVEILSSRIENSKIGSNSHIGPFAHIRLNSVVGENNRIGNFVELKNAQTGKNCKMAHLTYVGDATMGENCNIGCGVVFCNYNGQIKQRCELGNNVFVGSNVNLIAPIKLKDNAYIAAGSTLTNDVEKNEFAIARARQTNKQNFDNPYIKNRKNEKNK